MRCKQSKPGSELGLRWLRLKLNSNINKGYLASFGKFEDRESGDRNVAVGWFLHFSIVGIRSAVGSFM
jgi:hypothetical protein